MDPVNESLIECEEWFHSIELSPNVFTPGRKTSEVLRRELAALRLPNLHGKSILDIGAYDGYFSFAAERLGAARVVALDHYVWSTDMAAYLKEWRKSHLTGEFLPAPHESRHWQPDNLPGRKPFDLARKLLQSKVEPVVGDFMTMDLSSLGQFDVVLFLGVLYHLEDVLAAVRRLHRLTKTGGLTIIETEAMELPGLSQRACLEFFPERELNNDPSNWWSPNATAIQGLCSAAGFTRAQVFREQSLAEKSRAVARSAREFARQGLRGRFVLPPVRYRAVAHAHA